MKSYSLKKPNKISPLKSEINIKSHSNNNNIKTSSNKTSSKPSIKDNKKFKQN